ncbi:MAG: proprotein convertase P-domain-containing protein, partial [Flavobacteriales bacterium]|nr:proprotein convertase P-domain-containing protein [Flavobacteriales bacterium]
MSSKMRFTATAPAKSPVGGETYTFTPACLSPVASTSITSDCSTNSFMVAVSITALGTGPSVDIVSSTAGVLHAGVGLGTYVCGPFALGTPVTLSAVNTANAGCTNTLGSFSPPTTCDTIENGSCLPEPYPLIPDNGCDNGADLQVTIPVTGLNPELGSGPGQTFFQSLEFIVAHTYRGDLRIRLTSPSGQTRDLSIQQPGPQAEGSNFGNPNACPGVVVQLRDDAAEPITAISPDAPNVSGAFRPEQPLSGFTGAANGNWILRICDASPEDEGSLRYIRLRLRNVDCLGVVGGTTVPGTPCDDGDPQTNGDVYGGDCTCAGTGNPGVDVDARVLLEGCYDAGTGLMHDSLRAQGSLPLTEPYTGAGYVAVGGGGETTFPAVLAVQGPTAIVDWVILELRDASDASVVTAS